jgi:hypothetical protein
MLCRVPIWTTGGGLGRHGGVPLPIGTGLGGLGRNGGVPLPASTRPSRRGHTTRHPKRSVRTEPGPAGNNEHHGYAGVYGDCDPPGADGVNRLPGSHPTRRQDTSKQPVGPHRLDPRDRYI